MALSSGKAQAAASKVAPANISNVRLVERDLSSARQRLRADMEPTSSQIALLKPVRGLFWTSFRDRAAGVYYGVTARDRFVDIFAHYKRQLRADLAPYLINGQHDLEALQEVLSQREGQRELRIKDVGIQLRTEIEWFQNRVQEEQEAYQKRRDDDPDLLQAREDYTSWHAALGRPPYTERFSTLGPTAPVEDSAVLSVGPHDTRQHSAEPTLWKRLVGGLSSNKDVAQEKTTAQNRIHSAVELISSIFIAILSVVLIPSEVIFTLPAFEAILGVPEDEALVAALIFTTAMALIGYGIASFATRTYTRRLKQTKVVGTSTLDRGATDRTQLPYVPHLNTFWALGTIGLCTIGLLFAVFGATIRSRVPDVHALNKEASQISLEQDKADNRRRAGNLLPEQLTVLEKADLSRQQRSKNIADKRRDLRDPTPDFYTKADGWVALLIYLTLISSYAIHRNFSTDPIFEYEIAARNYAQQKNANRVALEQHLQRKIHYSSRLDTLRQKQSDLEHGRFHEIAELSDIQKEIEQLSKKLDQMKEANRKLLAAEYVYVRLHLVRFALYFCCFRFAPGPRTWRLLLNHFPRIEEKND